jgi:hypothetical protein
MNRPLLLTVALALAATGPLLSAQIRPPSERPPISQRPLAVMTNGAFACFTDPGGPVSFNSPLPALTHRDLNGFVSSSLRMDNDQCRSICAAHNFPFAGTQSSAFCFCGNSAGGSGISAQCKSSCLGRPGEICGGPAANSVSLATPYVPPPAPPLPANGGQCVINVAGPLYNHFEVQTWVVSGPAIPEASGARLYPLTWSVIGGGQSWSITVGSGHSMSNKRSWTIDSTSARANNQPPVTAVRYEARVLPDRLVHFSEQGGGPGVGALFDHQQQYIDGVAQTPGTTLGQSLEWLPSPAYAFPQAPRISGTFTYPVDDNHPYGFARLPGSTGSISCTWNVTL